MLFASKHNQIAPLRGDTPPVMLTLFIDVAGNGPSSKQKLESQKKKKRKRCEVNKETDELFPVVKDTSSETEDSGTDADLVGTKQSGEQQLTRYRVNVLFITVH